MALFSAGIIVIGDEILSGRTKDTNSNFIANHLIKSGIKLVEIRIIEDKESGEPRISHIIDLSTGMYKGKQILDPKD